MRVAVLHYHMRRGGVTRVVEGMHKALLSSDISLAVAAGDIPADETERLPPSAIVPDLAYDSATGGEELYAQLVRALSPLLGGEPDVWHIHNHCLGKNQAIPALVQTLADKNERILLHIHDFAEDGRPSNYRMLRETFTDDDQLGRVLYPLAPNIHYALLNPRDYRALAMAGIPEDQLHLLPNPVLPPPADGEEVDIGDDRELYLYPTRAIRRKNIGEMLLWAAADPDQRCFATTLAPTSDADLKPYAAWKQLVEDCDLPVRFELGMNHSFAGLLRTCRAVITTSIAEGFGLAFIEPWLVHRPLVGRRLQEITSDMEEAGLSLDGLYDRLDIPESWLDRPIFEREVEQSLKQSYAAYGLELPARAVEAAIAAIVREGKADFGRLSEQTQAGIIRHVAENREAARDMIPSCLDGDLSDEAIETNRRAILDAYGLARYGDRLTALYATVAAVTPEAPEHLSPRRVLDQFLRPERCYLLRT